jgi:hypothetical protein
MDLIFIERFRTVNLVRLLCIFSDFESGGFEKFVKIVKPRELR